VGYTVIALNHIVQSKFTNSVPDLALQKRDGVIILKRLTIILDEAGEKGCGLTNNNTNELSTYDLIAIQPTTTNAFSQACLQLSVPGPLTTHIISLDLASSPRLPFYLKHTLVRTAIRNGAVFEMAYAPAVANADSGSNVGVDVEAHKRNWWANARELMRVTKGKNVLVSGAAQTLSELRAPLDVANLITLLDVAQDSARNALEATPKSLVLRAQTRKTYRAVLSEPALILP
ncbi:PHP domain-like protein, partial [Clavulina sp. PMI_390]